MHVEPTKHWWSIIFDIFLSGANQQQFAYRSSSEHVTNKVEHILWDISLDDRTQHNCNYHIPRPVCMWSRRMGPICLRCLRGLRPLDCLTREINSRQELAFNLL